MQIRQRFQDNVEIEIMQAPFGQAEPIGLLFEGKGRICFPDFTWEELDNMAGSLSEKQKHEREGGSLEWTGDEFIVEEGENKITFPMTLEEFQSFGMLLWFRSIDPY